MSTFVQTLAPTPFGIYDSDPVFQHEADGMVVFVKRKLGDGATSVELSKKDIWTCFEEAVNLYGVLISQYQLKSDLASLLGLPSVYSGSIISGSVSGSLNFSNIYIKRTLEFLMRQADPYASFAGVGGSYDRFLTYLDIEPGRQDYNLYTELKRAQGPLSGSIFVNTIPSGTLGKMRVMDVMHYDPIASQHFLMNASNITNFLATEFNYESYVNSTVFYVLPVFEDVLRRSMLETAHRVRRSHYTYEFVGRNMRFYPIPGGPPRSASRIYMWVMTGQDPSSSNLYGPDGITSETISAAAAGDPTLFGISNPSNAPYGPLVYSMINAPGRTWIMEMTIALCKEVLGLIRNKIKVIPIPGGDLTLNGDDLVAQGREDKDRLMDQLREFLDGITYDKLLEMEASKAQAIATQMRFIPVPKPIIIG